jgi:hypothetical protein
MLGGYRRRTFRPRRREYLPEETGALGEKGNLDVGCRYYDCAAVLE